MKTFTVKPPTAREHQVRDAKRRMEALAEFGRVMRAADALAARLRGPMARALKQKNPITTFHRGLVGSFTVQGDHCSPVPGLHVYVRAREITDGEKREIRYRLEVTGPSELTEAEVIEVVKLLAKHRLPARRWACGSKE